MSVQRHVWPSTIEQQEIISQFLSVLLPSLLFLKSYAIKNLGEIGFGMLQQLYFTVSASTGIINQLKKRIEDPSISIWITDVNTIQNFIRSVIDGFFVLHSIV